MAQQRNRGQESSDDRRCRRRRRRRRPTVDGRTLWSELQNQLTHKNEIKLILLRLPVYKDKLQQ